MKSRVLNLSEYAFAGTEANPSTYERRRCPKCYYMIKPGEYSKAGMFTCGNCGTKLRRLIYHDGHSFPYLRQHVSMDRKVWSLFNLFIWLILAITDKYLRLRRYGLYCIVMLMAKLPIEVI